LARFNLIHIWSCLSINHNFELDQILPSNFERQQNFDENNTKDGAFDPTVKIGALEKILDRQVGTKSSNVNGSFSMKIG